MVANKEQSLDDFITTKLDAYFDHLGNKKPSRVHAMVVDQTEATVIRYVFHHCGNNQTKTAELLGISRGSLRSKIKLYNIKEKNI